MSGLGRPITRFYKLCVDVDEFTMFTFPILLIRMQKETLPSAVNKSTVAFLVLLNFLDFNRKEHCLVLNTKELDIV